MQVFVIPGCQRRIQRGRQRHMRAHGLCLTCQPPKLFSRGRRLGSRHQRPVCAGLPFLFTSRDGFNYSEGFGISALCGGSTDDAEAFLFVDLRTPLAMQPPAMAFA